MSWLHGKNSARSIGRWPGVLTGGMPGNLSVSKIFSFPSINGLPVALLTLALTDAGSKIKSLFAMVFSPTSQNQTSAVDLWHHTVIRHCVAALRDIYFLAWRAGNGSSITEEDVTRWANYFAASSFGDELFSTSLAIFLQPCVPPALQVRMPRHLLVALSRCKHSRVLSSPLSMISMPT